MFDGTLGRWRGETLEVELQKGVQPYHARPYPVPKAYEATLKQEVERLCRAGVLRKVNRSEWAAPTFIIPKKDKTVRFISDFRELNKRLRRKPYPIPKIQDLLLKLEGFTYATALDLNMGYYHIELSPSSKALCTIVLPFGKYEYQRLPMGLSSSVDIFQEKMSEMFQDLENVRAYIDDLLVLSTGTYEDHLEKLDEVLRRLNKAGLKVNAKKSHFCTDEVEYLGYRISRKGIQPIPKKVDAIQNIAVPTTKRQLRRFIGMINYYRDMWARRSHVLAPLASLTSKSTKWEWTDEHTKAFNEVKKILSRETLLVYPNFNETFEIHTDASDRQLGAVISQNNRPIAFYSKKLNDAQTRYTTTERELLAIVETLKEFRNILLGQKIRVYTDHKNLTYKNFNTARVLRWRLVLEEYGPELVYVKGEHNVVADALSRLDMSTEEQPILTDYNATTKYNAEMFGNDKNDLKAEEGYPLNFKDLLKAQQADTRLLADAKKNSDKYVPKVFRGGGKEWPLLTVKDKIYVPPALRTRVVEWYHSMLCHPGETRIEATIRQHFYWPNLRESVEQVVKPCHICQISKKGPKNYGHLPPKNAEAVPWEILCVDCIGPYTVRHKSNKKKTLQLWCVTMIDPATGWFEMKELPNKQPETIANIVELAWLTRYPRPEMVILDRGSEFMTAFRDMLATDYGIKRKPITVRNPQANAIIERIHQTLGSMLRCLQIYNRDDLDESDPWSGILAAVMYALRATYHTTTQATPMQLVFGRDAMLNIQFEADWNLIKKRKQQKINDNNRRENAKRLDYTYDVGDNVLVRTVQKAKYAGDPWQGPYQITAVNDNGTVRYKKGAVTDTINIRQLKPYVT